MFVCPLLLFFFKMAASYNSERHFPLHIENTGQMSLPYYKYLTGISEHLSCNKPHTLTALGVIGHINVRSDAPRVIEPGKPVIRFAVGHA